MHIQLQTLYLKNLHNFVHLKYSIYQRMLKISYVQHTKYFKECWKFYALIEFPLFFKFEVRNFSENAQNSAHLMYTILFFFFSSRNCWKLCVFNEHYYSKNFHNFVRSKYKFFWRSHKISHDEPTQFFSKTLKILRNEWTLSLENFT